MKKIIAVAVLVLLGACGKEEVSFSTLEDARAQARSNGLWNAKMYVAENPRFDTHSVVSHGDSSQTPDCPQGDGWATVSIMKVEGKVVEKYVAKCSTVSGTIGCYLEQDFKKKSYANEEGQCQPLNKVPHPLPKIAK